MENVQHSIGLANFERLNVELRTAIIVATESDAGYASPMSSLLELPAVRERVLRISVGDYHRLGEIGVLSEKVELLRGLVVTKRPKSPLHELVAQKLLTILLARVPPGFVVRPERPLTLRDSEPEPDGSRTTVSQLGTLRCDAIPGLQLAVAEIMAQR